MLVPTVEPLKLVAARQELKFESDALYPKNVQAAMNGDGVVVEFVDCAAFSVIVDVFEPQAPDPHTPPTTATTRTATAKITNAIFFFS